jgi:hypothetical protein
MKDVNHRYALRFDRRWSRTAHVFANRFGAVLQTTEPQFLGTLRYVVRNPVEAVSAQLPTTPSGRASRLPQGLRRHPSICVSIRFSSASPATVISPAADTSSSSSASQRAKTSDPP